jgi:8-oxo-dGTP pyrophosphatase MutT (NUDIX family)
MKITSCGILVCSTSGELLLCHATGTAWWDIPKGGGEPGETPIDTALRETREECGLVFQPDDPIDLGHGAYRPGKDLHLFAAWVPPLDLRACRCSTSFRDRFERLRPEADAFEWVAMAQVPGRCAKRMAALLAGLPLSAVFERLQQRGRLAQPVWDDTEQLS